MSHFNFRNILISSIVNRASQPNSEIASLCCSAIRNAFTSDSSGDLCLEIVKEMASIISFMKHTPLEQFLETLKSLRLRVHANESKNLHKKAKQERRKRKRAGEAGDDVDAEMLEASAVTDTTVIKRFQADTLHEVSLIYFR